MFIAIAGFVVLLLMFAIPSLMRRHHFERVSTSLDATTLLDAAIPLMASSTDYTTYQRRESQYNPSITNLPAIIVEMKPAYVSVGPDSVRLEFHGGFDHYGFEIRRIDDSWNLSQYTERYRQTILERK